LKLGALHIDICDEQVTHTWMKLIDTHLPVKRYCTSMMAKGKGGWKKNKESSTHSRRV
jgi:hypothetical protein